MLSLTVLKEYVSGAAESICRSNHGKHFRENASGGFLRIFSLPAWDWDTENHVLDLVSKWVTRGSQELVDALHFCLDFSDETWR